MLTDPRVDRDEDDLDAEVDAAAPRRRLPWGRVETLFGLGIALLASLWVLLQLHPSLLIADTTPAGGDMGAHVWGPAYLRDHLLPSGRLTGWTTDWYAGFPAYQFYMVVPSLLILALDLVLPYGVAFKLVTVAGILSLPVCAWALGRLARVPFPGPPLLAVATVPFLFDRSFTIYGGNIASTLAGEFTFSISLSLTVLYFGVLMRGLRTGQHRALAAVLLALIGLCHLIPAFFAIAGTVVVLLVHLDRRRWAIALPGPSLALLAAGASAFVPQIDLPSWMLLSSLVVSTAFAAAFVAVLIANLVKGRSGAAAAALLIPAVFLHPLPVACAAAVAFVAAVIVLDRDRTRYVVTLAVVAGLLGAFWAIPFAARHGWMTDMGWEKVPVEGATTPKSIWNYLLRNKTFDDLFAGMTAGISFLWVVGLAAVGAVVSFLRGRRLGMALTILALGTAVAFVHMPASRLWNARLLPFWYLCLYFLAALAIAEAVRLLSVLLAFDPWRPLRLVRFAAAPVMLVLVVVAVGLDLGRLPLGHEKNDNDGRFDYTFLGLRSTSQNFVRGWAKWNYEGYERKPAYPEYYDVVQRMARISETDGCGRAMWEYEKEHDRYGTPMALMLLPHWTDGCIGSMEGLYFESSATTPYHFLNAAALSHRPSNPQRGLDYPTLDVDLGVRQLQLMGVRYYMAISIYAKQEARLNPNLRYVASSGPWEIYRVENAPLVEPLPNEPVVVRGVASGGEPWEDMATEWFSKPVTWDVMLAADGPSEWRRIDRGDVAPQIPVDHAEVSNIEQDDDRISFDVDRPGTPVLVKVSHFPNWKADGARGPWRVAPNLMVVIPTDNHVELRYGLTGVDLGAWALTFLGLAGVVILAARGRVRFLRAERRRPRFVLAELLDREPKLPPLPDLPPDLPPAPPPDGEQAPAWTGPEPDQ